MKGWFAIWLSVPLLAADWPQLLGPGRSGVAGEALPAKVRIEARPVWKMDVGEGFAQPVVAEGKLILFHRRGGREIVQALDAATGKPRWSFDYPTQYRDDFGFDEGPRAAPTVQGGRVFTHGAEGMLHALDLATGRKLWSVDTREVFRPPKGFFGAAASPLAEGSAVILHVGGPDAGVVAFDAASGQTRWRATSDEAGYASPVAATVHDRRRLFCFTRSGLTSLDPVSGRVEFQFRWRSRSHASVNAALPLVLGDRLFLSASYGVGATLLRIPPAGDPAQLWASDEAMSNHYATAVHHDGHLYGFHGRQEMGPSLRCVEAATGKVKWSVEQFRAGSLLLAGKVLLIQRENGELVLAPATPEAFRPAARAQVLPGTVRAFPALANGLYYVRNERTLAVVRLQP